MIIQFQASVIFFNDPSIRSLSLQRGPCRCDARHPAASCVFASVPAVEHQFAMSLVYL